jgi:hypothetical protein
VTPLLGKNVGSPANYDKLTEPRVWPQRATVRALRIVLHAAKARDKHHNSNRRIRCFAVSKPHEMAHYLSECGPVSYTDGRCIPT